MQGGPLILLRPALSTPKELSCRQPVFRLRPPGGPPPLPVQFTDTSTGSITNWSWDFGDGGTSTAQYPSHVYSTAGTYTVSLTVTGPGGTDVETQANLITVSAPPPSGIDEYTKLMLHFNGSNGSKIFTDSSDIPKTVTGYGNAQDKHGIQ